MENVENDSATPLGLNFWDLELHRVSLRGTLC